MVISRRWVCVCALSSACLLGVCCVSQDGKEPNLSGTGFSLSIHKKMEFVSLKSLSVMPLIYTNSPKSFDSSEPMNIHEPAELIGSPSCIIALDWSEPLGARPDPGERGEPRRQRRASRPHAPTAPLDGREPSRPGPGPEGIAPGADGSAGTALRRSGATPAADTAAPAARCPLPAGVPPVLGPRPPGHRSSRGGGWGDGSPARGIAARPARPDARLS